MDVGKENNWTHLDGTGIPSNEFYSTLDAAYWSQPNGGRGQNCAVINEDTVTSPVSPNKTQDKACHSLSTSDMICYRNVLDSTNCFSWASPIDGVFREHCYWISVRRPGFTTHNVADAMQNCLYNGGSIAPLIDTMQKSFIETLVMAGYLSKEASATIWIGTHGSGSTRENWNDDPMYLLAEITSPSGEKCLGYSAGGTYSWHLCDSDAVAVLCYKSAKLYTLPTAATTKSEMTSTDATLCPTVATSTSGSAVKIGTGSEGPVSVEEIKKELSVDPKETNAYKLSKISVYEDRPTAKALGGLGIGILVGVLMFIAVLDCQRIENVLSKSQPQTQNTQRSQK